MWEATIKCDARFDNTFYYAVKTTGIFCRPSCKSKAPNYENTVFFITADDALHSGFRPCKRCRPDLYTLDYDPQNALVEKAKTFLEETYHEKLTLNHLADEIGVSQFYLNRIFKEKTGFTPHKYLEKLRIRKAITLLESTELTSTEICFQIGYETLSSFYKAFKRETSCSPKEFCKKIE
ncbi:bifunctional transcriptional activator/DNA repair enzyme AdaA [Pseudalkalibacillus sp. A8]|uniref:bifunctional transcriptional activator/DNA repair enzyme AdaA n=1 Tax=Pseudalkalibacillus sp. A8 TaxID=3382641 RepID=UPI0038B63500